MAQITTVPACDLKNFARWVATATEQYFENPDNRIRFEKWRKERIANANRTQQKNLIPEEATTA